MKILVAMPRGKVRDSFIGSEEAAQLEALGGVIWNDDTRQFTEDELSEHLTGVDVCIIGWGNPCISEKVLKKADQLKCIAHTGGTVAGFVSEAVYDRGIAVISGNEVFARSVAESVIAYTLYMLRDIGKFSAQLLRDGWSQPDPYNEGLLDQKVGLIGFGAVARHAAHMLNAFGVKLYIDADHVTPEEAASYGAQKASLDEILSTCKIISIHLARTPETFHRINRERLRLIQPGAILVNTARGSIIDEQALAEELKSGRFRAALDVYEEEPLPMSSPLRTLPNVLLMPHMGGPTIDRRPFVTQTLIREIPKVLAGEKSNLTITREMMHRMTH